MYNFRPLPYRPQISQAIVTPVAPTVVTPSVVSAGAPVPEGLFWTALAGAAAWAAIRTGLREKESTVVRAAGWAGGVAAGLAALVGLTGVLSPAAARTLPVRWYWA